MKRRQVVIIAAFLVFVVLAMAGIVWLAYNYKSEPAARPCLSELSEIQLQEVRAYADNVPGGIETAKAIADEVDVVCVLELELELNSPSSRVMHYYEDDDGFAGFLSYALVTAHARQISGHLKISGTPDFAQRIALNHLMTVRSDGNIYAAYTSDSTNWLRQDISKSVAHPGVLITHARYGDAARITVKQAFDQTPPNKYRKGTIPGSGGGTNSFENIGAFALTPTGSDDDNRTNGRPGTSPSVAPSSTQQGRPTPASSRANPTTPRARRS